MTRIRMPWALGGMAVALLLAGPSHGQDDAEEAQRAQDLIRRIRRTMRDVDRLLFIGASAARAEATATDTARSMGELLDEAEERSRAVCAGLDELIDLARQSERRRPPS